MTNPLGSVCIAVCALSVAQCSGQNGSPTAPSSTASLSTQVEHEVSAARGNVDPTVAARPLAKDLASLAGDWKGDVTLREQDGDVFKFKVALTLAELGIGGYQGTVDGNTITLSQTAPDLYDVTFSTGETQTCSGNPVVYTGDASSIGKTLAITVQGMNNHCRLEILDFDLKKKQ